MITLEQEFSRTELGEPVHFRNLTVFPLLRLKPEQAEPDYLLLDEAVQQGVAKVTELNGGSVPELRFQNNSARPVLLLHGEELIGAKQNRVLNLTILVPAKQTIVIPVSCVEAGRWNAVSAEFAVSQRVMYAGGRAACAQQVTESLRESGAPRSDQSAIWAHIAGKAARMAAPSPTQAMSAVFEQHAISVEEYVRAFTWKENQAGVVFAIGGQPLGADLVDHPATMHKLFGKLIRSYALDALDAPQDKSEAASKERASEFLARVAAAQSFAQPASGLGKDIRFSSETVAGAALWAEDRYVHLCAFAANGGASRTGMESRMAPPAGRRRFWRFW